jgi:hypothetical protein
VKIRLLLAAAVAALVAVPAALGAPPSLSVDHDPIARGDTFVLSGCGYPATSISFEVEGPRKSGIDYFTSGEPVGSDGCYSAVWTAWWSVAGDYQITSYYRDPKTSARKKGAVVKFTVT